MTRTTTILMAVLCFTAATTHAALQSAMYVEGVAGTDKTDKDHKEWISVQTLYHGVAGDGTPGGTGAASGEFSVVKMIDATTPIFAAALTAGTTYPVVKIDIYNADPISPGGPTPYFEWELENATVVSLSTVGGGGVPLEEINFNYEEIKWTYIENDAAASFLGDIVLDWDDPAQAPSVTTTGDVQGFELITSFAVPEPGTLGLLAASGLALARRCRRGNGNGADSIPKRNTG